MNAALIAAEKGRSKLSQEKSWSEVRKKFETFAASHPDDHISTHLVRLRELDISRKDPTHFYRTRDMVRNLGETVLAGVDQQLDNSFYFPNVVAGEYMPTTISPIRHLMNNVRDKTTAIVELGSGWSCNLFQLYVGLGATRSKTLDYHGAEYTDEGQRTAERIAGYDGKINYAAHSFDYRNPDISYLEKYRGHILVFTRHSIEQVDLIDPKLYEQLWKLKADVTLIHFEPVGWQSHRNLVAKRKADDRPFFEAVGKRVESGSNISASPLLKSTDPKVIQAENAAWWSWRLKYNTNLYSIVTAYEVLGKLNIRREIFDFAGVGNILNPTTMLDVEFIKPKPAASPAPAAAKAAPVPAPKVAPPKAPPPKAPAVAQSEDDEG